MKLERLGPYKLERILGRGGMGAVYVGLNVETGGRAAVKVLNPVLADDVNFRDRFKSEVETLKKLLHPNIVQLFGFGEQDETLFYVMELVQGRSLHDELLSGRRFQWREVVRIAIDISRALKHAHDRGVIHRDLKPANLLIDSHDHVKLTDFGIAKLYGGVSFTAEGGVLGTADYMAPEQAEGKPVTARCDLYSLGSVIYALLTGRPPFSGKSLPEVIQGLRFETPIPLRRINPDVPEEFETIVTQLLEKDPQKRIPTAMTLAHRLKAMEHALSLETRVAGAEGIDEWLDADADSPPAQVPQGMTVPLPAKTSIGTDAAAAAEKSAAATPAHSAQAEERPASKQSDPIAAGKGIPPTLVRSATRAEGAAPPHEAGEAAAKKTVFTTVTEDELRRSDERPGDDDHPLTAWLKIAGLLVAVLSLASALAYLIFRPPSADALYSRIKSSEREGVEQLAEREPDLAKFLTAFPNDPRRDELKRLQEEVEMYRLQRRFESRARLRSGVGSLSPIERAYLDAVRQSATDPEGARARFQALVDVFAGGQQLGKTPAERRTAEQCLDLAKQQIAQLEKSLAPKIAAERELLAARLSEADALANSDRQAAQRVWRGVVELYGGKAWAQDLVVEARSKLNAQPHGP